MDYTINCISTGNHTRWTPDELGLAPANLGLESDPVSLETDDEVALNQSRRAASNAGHGDRPITKHYRILKYTSTTILSTFNTWKLVLQVI